MDKKPGLIPLKDVIRSILAESKIPFNPEDGLIWKVWREVVGEAIAANTEPLWIKQGRLRVKVMDPMWLQELGYAEKTIKEKLNKRLGREAVAKIEFKMASR